MHNGMIRFGEEKMAKSVGNIRTLADALDEYGRDALIMYFLAGHYRQPLGFSAGGAGAGASARWSGSRNFGRLVDRSGPTATGGPTDRPVTADLRDRFFAALRDDFNTPQALAALFDLVGEGNRRLEAGEPFPGAAAALAEMLGCSGLENLLARDEPADEEAAAPRDGARAGAPRPATSRAPTSCATSSPSAATRCATPPTARCWSAIAAVGEPAAGAPSVASTGATPSARRCAAAAPGAARLCGRRSAALGGLGRGGLAEAPTASGRSRRDELDRAVRLAATIRAWPRASSPIRTPTPPTCSTAEDALVVALDQVQDPQNLGAVCRSAECAGASGRGDARAPRGRT